MISRKSYMPLWTEKYIFLDLDDGSYTRNPINVGAPLKEV